MLKPDEPLHKDHLITRAELGAGELMGALLKLEMTDRIWQLPRKSFVRRM